MYSALEERIFEPWQQRGLCRIPSKFWSTSRKIMTSHTIKTQAKDRKRNNRFFQMPPLRA